MYLSAFPDGAITVDDQIAEGDTVATRWTGRGTHQGELMGIPPTGKQVTVAGLSYTKFKSGKMVESWANWDTLGMLQQIGAVPATATA
jgi:predicted ester cyclase